MSIKILSWNILADIWIDYDDYAYISHPMLDTDVRYPKMDYYLEELDCDIILLQEVTDTIRRQLIKDYKGNYIVSPLFEHGSNHWADQLAGDKSLPNGNLTLVSRDRFEIREEFSLQLTSNGNRAGITILRDRYFDIPMIIANIHLDDSNYDVRIHQIHNLLSFLQLYKENYIILIGGDFNEDVEGETHELLRSASYEGAISWGPGTYLCEGEIIDNIYTYSPYPPNVTVSGEIILYELQEHYGDDKKICEYQTLARLGSDHYPIRAIIDVSSYY